MLIALAFLRSSYEISLSYLHRSLSLSRLLSLRARFCVCVCVCLWFLSPGGTNKPKQGKKLEEKKTLQKLHHFHVQTMCKGFGAADSRISPSRIALFVCLFLFYLFFYVNATSNCQRITICLLLVGFRGKPATRLAA